MKNFQRKKSIPTGLLEAVFQEGAEVQMAPLMLPAGTADACPAAIRLMTEAEKLLVQFYSLGV